MILTLIPISLKNLQDPRAPAAINRGHVVGRLPEAGPVHRNAKYWVGAP